jgi:hypothetical protein
VILFYLILAVVAILNGSAGNSMDAMGSNPVWGDLLRAIIHLNLCILDTNMLLLFGSQLRRREKFIDEIYSSLHDGASGAKKKKKGPVIISNKPAASHTNKVTSLDFDRKRSGLDQPAEVAYTAAISGTTCHKVVPGD